MRRKTNILFLTQYHSIGGLERVVLNLCRALQAMPHVRPMMMSYDRIPGVPTLRERFIEAGIDFEAFIKPRGFSISALRQILRTVRDRNIDIIHTHDLGPLIYGALVKVLLRTLYRQRIRLVHTQHGFSAGLRRRDRFYNRVFAALADRICAVSPAVRNAYDDLGVPAEKVCEIRNGMEFPRTPLTRPDQLKIQRQTLVKSLAPSLRSVMEAHLEDFWILNLGRIHHGKGQDHVLEIWNSLSPLSRSRAVLMIVGPETSPGALAKLRSRTIQNPDRVFFVGNAPVPLHWYESSDLYISASEYEGLPLAPVEAAGAGLPVLLSDIPGHGMLRDFAKFFDLNDPRGAAALIENAQAQGRSRQWDHTQPLRVQYSVDQMARHYLGAYGLREAA